MRSNCNLKRRNNSKFFQSLKDNNIGNRFETSSMSPLYLSYLYQSPSFQLKTHYPIKRHQQVQNCEGFFPFGRDREKIQSYVCQQMKPSVDSENKIILERFRIQAIKFRNQRVMKHVGKVPYLTESMDQGSTIDTTKLVEQPQLHYVKMRKYNTIDTGPTISSNPPISPLSAQAPPFPICSRRAYPTEMKANKRAKMTKDASISVNFEKQFPMQQGKRCKKRFYSIEEFEQEQTISKIDNLLHKIHRKIQKSNKALARGITENHLSDRPSSKQKKHPINLTEQNPENSQMEFRLENKQQTNEVRKWRNINVGYSKNVKNRMNLIKKNRKRMQDLDQLTSKK